MSEDETHSSSTEDDDEEEEEEDDSPPEAGRKNRAASKNLEAKAAKRGKGSPADNSAWMSIEVRSGLPGPSLEPHRKYQKSLFTPERPSFPPCNIDMFESCYCSPARDSSPRFSSEGSLDPKERVSMSPPPAYSPSAKGDDKEASQRASSDRGKAPEIIRVVP